MAETRSAVVREHLCTLFDAGTAVGLDDGRLLERFVERRDESAFAALLERHGPLILGVCRRMLSEPADVDDAFQATFLVLVRRAGSLRNRRLLGTWLYKVAFRVSLRARKKAGRQGSAELAKLAHEPANEVELCELRSVINEEVRRLPSRFRLPVVLCYFDGLSHEEAARRLGCPLGTVNSRLATARDKLRVRLARRGLHPSPAHMSAALCARTAMVAVPSSLQRTTLAVALKVAQSGTVGGAAPATVVALSRGWRGSVTAIQLVLATASLCAIAAVIVGIGFLLSVARVSSEKSLEEGHRSKPDGMLVTSAAPVQSSNFGSSPRSDKSNVGQENKIALTGKVVMPDGSPASGAIVRAISSSDEPTIVTHGDQAGRFELRGVFGNGSRLHASSPDGRFQTALEVGSAEIRARGAQPFELSLAPARAHEVTVFSSDERPVEGTSIFARGQRFEAWGRTGRDGKAKLWFPAIENVWRLVAWHRSLGLGSAPEQAIGAKRSDSTILLEPLPVLGNYTHTIRLLDVDGKAVSGVELGFNIRTDDSQWISAEQFPEARVRTDSDGAARVPWLPRGKVQFVKIAIMSPDWNKEKTIHRVTDGMTTVYARRRQSVEGRIIMPEGTSALGVLVSGFGNDANGFGDVTATRARGDGSFTLRVTPGYSYKLAIEDNTWASDPWIGVPTGKETGKPDMIAIKAYPATPLTIHVSRGPQRSPITNAWVIVSDSEYGRKRSLRTDSQGLAITGVGRGSQKVILKLDPWTEERSVEVTSNEPITVDFHRAWEGERHLTGQLTRDGAPFAPSRNIWARAWARRNDGPPLKCQPRVRPDGMFEVDFDAEEASLLVLDARQKRSGFAQIGLSNAPIRLAMTPTATYGGTLLNDRGEPIAGMRLHLYVKIHQKQAREEVLEARTDRDGHFRFEATPTSVPLQLDFENLREGPRYTFFRGEDRSFKPGEVSENDRIVLIQTGALNITSDPRLNESSH